MCDDYPDVSVAESAHLSLNQTWAPVDIGNVTFTHSHNQSAVGSSPFIRPKIGRDLTGRDLRRQSCPPSPLLHSAQSSSLARKTMALEKSFHKSLSAGMQSPCTFKVDCRNSPVTPMPRDGLYHRSFRHPSDDCNGQDPTHAQIPTSLSKKSANPCKQVFLSLISSVIFLLKLLIIGVSVILVGLVIHNFYLSWYAKFCDYNTKMNITALTESLNTQVYGQHLVVGTIPPRIEKYLSDPEASNPLVLSFYGWTGVGKNFVSGLIADHIRSSSVTKIIVPLMFPHTGHQDIYAQQLRHVIVNNIQDCAVNLFIIDEIDKATWDIQQELRRVIEEISEMHLQDRRAKVVMLLLSNQAASLVNRFLFDALSQDRSREDVHLEEVNAFIESEAEDLMSLHIWLKHQSPVNQMLPFLPLQKSHVEDCVRRDLQSKGYKVSQEVIAKVIESLQFAPKSLPLFSTTGCRKVSSAVDLFVDE